MVVEKTFKYLLELSSDISKQMADSPAFGVFNKDKIDAFYGANELELNKASKVVKALLDEHVLKDVNGKPQSRAYEGHFSWFFKSKEDNEEYHRKYQEFINQPVTIHL